MLKHFIQKKINFYFIKHTHNSNSILVGTSTYFIMATHLPTIWLSTFMFDVTKYYAPINVFNLIKNVYAVCIYLSMFIFYYVSSSSNIITNNEKKIVIIDDG